MNPNHLPFIFEDFKREKQNAVKSMFLGGKGDHHNELLANVSDTHGVDGEILSEREQMFHRCLKAGWGNIVEGLTAFRQA